MAFKEAVFLLLLFQTLNREAAATHWTYKGVEEWAEESPDCAGKRQSPVDISEPKAFVAPPFLFKNYGLINVSLQNNGHSLSVRLHPQQEQQRPRLAGGGLSGTFDLDGFHFHWGSEDSRGSEHLLGGCAFPAEMHLVHFKRKYKSVKEALKYDDGLAVLGVWLVPGRDSDSSAREDLGGGSTSDSDSKSTTRKTLEDDGTSDSDSKSTTRKTLEDDSTSDSDSKSTTRKTLEDDSLDQPQHAANNSRKVPTEDDHSAAARKWFRDLTPPSELLDDQLITVDLRQLIPFNDRDFYRYNGSLTTPPCTANVEWTIFENPVAVPLRFLKGLRALANGEGEHISNNFRPPQKLGRRKVLYSGTRPKPNPSCKRQPAKSLSPSCTGIPSLGSFGTVAPGECAEGQATSPADLHLGSATPSYSKRLSWKRKGGCANAVVTLNGRLLKVSFPGEEPQWELSGGDLASPYHLNHLLFRWGSDHHLGGLSFPLEVQLVHYSSKSDDVVIVSKFFQEPIDLPDVLDSFQHTEPSRNKLLEVVFEAAQELSENPGTEETIPSPDISDLVGDASSFYEYGGSFPDAPCLGEVTWMVLRTAGVIARTQLEDLRKLKDENGDEITTNNRPLQPLGNRTLFLRVNQHELVHEYKTMLLRFKRKLENGTLQVSENSGSLQYAAVSLQRMCLLGLAVSFVARLGV
ncbi:uncharacterized protein [Penaeus vannamei]|uniref:uncharacterized protein isoform X6 n=1 Tax=Penaeus vannamei TaxID=6689 RepID=UPI00387F808F